MRNSVCIFALNLLCLLHSCRTRKVDELLTELNKTPPPSSYRVSAPKLKQPLNRVPAHLQDIGYVYEDADDVIHIIEPPQRFQLLKRLVSQTESPRKLRITRVESMNHYSLPKPMAMTAATAEIFSASKFKTKVKKMPESTVKQLQPVKQQLGGGIKVNQPVKLLHTRAHNSKPVFSNDDSIDLVPQEAQTLAMMSPPLPLPREILASVRKTERLLQQQPQPKQHLHRVTQRQKKLATHTVVIGQAFERNKFYRTTDHKIMDEKLRKSRVRREVRNIPIHGESFAGARRTDKLPSALDVLKNANLDIQKGTKLLLHLDELLKNASLYLPDKGEVVELSEKSNNSNKSFLKSITKSDATNPLEQRFSPSRNQSANKRRRIFTDVNVNKQNARTNLALIEGANKTNYNQFTAGSLLYDDVMSNIRNMLHTKNRQLLEDQQNSSFNGRKVTVNFNGSLPLLPIDNGEPIEVKQLQEYIYELQRISKSLQNQNTDVSSAPTQQSEQSANMTDSPDWYLITSQGSIYEARSRSKPKPTTSFFHRFPDIPVKRGVMVNNQTLLSPHATLA
ncbi:PREDICTED: uncharacterized protein LOC108371754 [Rhagoletis zephyria]|uniref:uncharacterized protein LOC108371754 n=1 Tax=Rhagoletis zephyria TaxID=28612 RepID=UPI000811A4DB|nr:PREDICTED: uncharacterized protein LOC108371754 [Rhagoletis zephyria]